MTHPGPGPAAFAEVARGLTRTLGKMELALGAIQDALVWTDHTGRVQWCNGVFDRLVGRPHLQVLGASLLDLLPLSIGGRPVPAPDHPLLAVLRDGGVVQAMYEYGLPPGATRWLHVSGALAALGPSESSPVLVIRDETCRVTTEAALRRSEQQLRQAQKMNAIGQLAGGIAHDFNNLLTSILGYADLLRGRLAGDPAAGEDVGQIQRAAQRAAGLTRQLLAFSRQQALVPSVLDPVEAVVAVTRLVAPLLGERIAVDVRCPRPVGRVRADPTQLEQVLLNLLLNARDAIARTGRVTIALDDVVREAPIEGAAPAPAPAHWVRFAVTDTGCGMDAATQAHLFEPFFTTKPVGQGTGLGLATVFGIARQSGGFVEVDTVPGHGSTFAVYLPRVGAIADALADDGGPSEGGAVTGTVLLVEDDPLVRQLAARILRERGYRLLEAPHGRAALDVAAAHGGRIDVLVTDVVMPELTGPELVAALVPRRPELQVLFVSGYPQLAGVDGAALDGGEFLAKPYQPAELLRRVARLRGRGVGRFAAAPCDCAA